MPTLERVTSEPVWDIAKIFPDQGAWSVEEYLALDTNRLIEFSQGYIEVLPMPSQRHQTIMEFLTYLIGSFIRRNRVDGKFLYAPMKVKLWEGKFREPDVLFMWNKHAHKRHNQYWEGADLVMEIVSPDEPKRDTDTKRREYAMANIPEYWIINPLEATVSVLTLDGERYAETVYRKDEVAESILLEGFSADVTEIFSQPV